LVYEEEEDEERKMGRTKRGIWEEEEQLGVGSIFPAQVRFPSPLYIYHIYHPPPSTRDSRHRYFNASIEPGTYSKYHSTKPGRRKRKRN
jgi:hypothetical protein